MSDRTALVVLRSGPPAQTTGGRAAEAPADPAAAATVVDWFRSHGFDAGPVVGISFAITGGEELFSSALGDGVWQAGELSFSLSSLDPDVRSHVEAVVVTAPPDFGPGSP